MPFDRHAADAIHRHVAEQADIQPARYLGPYGAGGLSRLERPGASGEPVEFIARGPAGRTWTPGAILAVGSPLGGSGRVILQDPPPGQIGASATQVQRPAAPLTVGSPMLVRLVPQPYASGQANQPAAVLGAGFRPFHSVTATRFDPIAVAHVPDDRFDLHDVTFIDSTRFELLVDVAPGVPEGTPIDISLVLAG